MFGPPGGGGRATSEPESTGAGAGVGSGSGSTGLAALQFGCTYIGFEIDPEQVAESSQRLKSAASQISLCRSGDGTDPEHQAEIVRNGRLDL